METTTFNVPSLSCSNCSNKIQEGISSMKGIINVSVDMKAQNVTVNYDENDIQPHEIRKKVSTMGYEVVQ